jgi:uncharacterized Rmd1/YagE family protein
MFRRLHQFFFDFGIIVMWHFHYSQIICLGKQLL